MNQKLNLKSILKLLKLNESTISMVLGALVIVVVGFLVVNYFRSAEPGSTFPDAAITEDSISLPTTHLVQAGETLWSISEKYYKTGYNWVDIVKANNLPNQGAISEGQELTIPNVEPRAVETSQPTQVAQEEEAPTITTPETTSPKGGEKYTVVRGDNLWDIAVRVYGDGYRWTDIARANNLANPDLIHAGNVFVLPD